ncbi:MAG: STAS domain-containing protein [Proteobacteria bacterium]|nr:STAS domain-containing protein [Pseudomonadota bacterium]
MEFATEAIGLRISGTVFIQDIKAVLPALNQLLLTDIDPIRLDMSSVESIDTAALQLLVAFRKSAVQQGKAVELSPVAQSVRDALELTGLDALFFGE